MSNGIGWADVVAFASELSGVSETAQADILAHVNSILDVSLFRNGELSIDLRMARIMLAAHIGASMPAQGGGAGAVVSESAGGLSRTYSIDSATSSTALGSTPYGLQYTAIMKRQASRGPWVI